MNKFLRGVALSLTVFSAFAQAGAPEQLSIPTAGLSNSPAPLIGFLFKPEGNGPHPAVVMMHGCGGAYAKKGELNARHLMWGEYLAKQGYVTLMLDSFTPRGIEEICTQKFSDRTLKESDRDGDAYAALAALRQRSDIDAKHIGLLGWSHGAGVVLSTIGRKSKLSEGFNAAVAFYPGCSDRAKKPASFKPYAPLLVLIGESDDWTPAAPCKTLAAAVAARTPSSESPMQIVTYPNTWHDFDNPALKKTSIRHDVPNGVNPGQGVHTGPNPEAREDAMRRVTAFFSDKLK